MSLEEAEASADDMPDGAAEAIGRAVRRDAGRRRDGRRRDAGRAAAAAPARPNEPRGPDYKAFITKFDEIVDGRGSVRRRRS